MATIPNVATTAIKAPGGSAASLTSHRLLRPARAL